VKSIKKRKVVLKRPLPLDKVSALGVIASKTEFQSEEGLKIMEKLYNKGFLTYPVSKSRKYSPIDHS
jgi:DNA topoisomerase IA